MIKTKQELRKWAKEERKKLDIKQLSKKIILQLKDTTEYINAQNIMLFYPLENEIDLLKLLDDDSKTFYLPKIAGENLLCCPYKKGEELCLSCFKTKEPKTEPVENNIPDLIIVPALAVDKNKYRLGYGGGFYDRMLCHTEAKTIVCIPQKLCLETVFPEEHDIKIDKIISV